MKARPKLLKKDGKPLFVVLPFAEYQRMREVIEDLNDRLLIAEAEKEDRGKPYYTLDQIKARFAARPKHETARRNGRKSRRGA